MKKHITLLVLLIIVSAFAIPLVLNEDEEKKTTIQTYSSLSEKYFNDDEL